jgi:DNA polymerase-3 subunit chi
MTRIAFHFGAAQKWQYASRLLRKAVGRGSKVVVVVDSMDMAQLENALWSLSPTEFIPHCHANAAGSACQRSPIVLADSLQEPPHLGEVLLNLGVQVPLGFQAFERVIEVVSSDETERNQARARWRHYAQSGLQIDRHDIQAKEGR